jgi:site-specific DNA recombinase
LVEYVLGNYEASPEGEVRKDLDATFAKWENLVRVERSRRGKRGKATKGLFVAGRVPFGYELDENSFAGLAINEKQAETVRLIFRLYTTEGESIRGIAEILSERGIKTYSGKTEWAKSSVARILGNGTYAGTLYYNRTKRTAKGQEDRPIDEWIEIQVTPIVEPALFAEAQRRLKRNRMVRRRKPKRFYMLSGMVFCPECGRPFSAETKPAGKHRRKNDAKSYRHRAAEGHCRNQIISARRLEPLVWNKIVNILLDPENLKSGYKSSLEQQKATHNRHRRRLEVLKRASHKIEQKRDKLLKAYLDPDIQLTKTEFLKQREQLDHEAANTDDEIQAMEEQLSAFELPPEYETIELFAREIREQLETAGSLKPQDKRKILELLHVKVFIAEDGKIWLEGWFDTETHGLSSNSGL